jgi:hypothetical protein
MGFSDILIEDGFTSEWWQRCDDETNVNEKENVDRYRAKIWLHSKIDKSRHNYGKKR